MPTGDTPTVDDILSNQYALQFAQFTSSSKALGAAFGGADSDESSDEEVQIKRLKPLGSYVCAIQDSSFCATG